MRKSILSFLFFIPSLLFAQRNSIVVEGKITDAFNKPIQGAAVQCVGTFNGTSTDDKGLYSISLQWPATLKTSLLSYQDVFKRIGYEGGKDTLRINFVLVDDSTSLQEVVIGATYEPELLKEGGTLMDFETNQNKLWLLYKYKDGDHLEVYDTGKNMITRAVLKHHSNNIYITPHNFLYIENSDSIRLLSYNTTNNLIREKPMVVSEFHEHLSNLTAFNYPCYYYKWNRGNNSAMVYWYTSGLNKRHRVLYSYGNSDLSRQNDSVLNNSNYFSKVLSDDRRELTSLLRSQKTGKSEYTNNTTGKSSADDWSKNSREDEKEMRMSELMYHCLNCPLKIIRDSIYIFNFDNDSIYVFSFNNMFIRQMPLSSSLYQMEDASQNILVNEEQNECYFEFVKHGATYLQKIDLNTGERLVTQKLGFPFPEKIRIWSGYVYYSCSDDKDGGMFARHLYRQKIN